MLLKFIGGKSDRRFKFELTALVTTNDALSSYL